ncbi:acid protease [Suillus cothurnatus]|nr:acid protease [Suillus cothurnatus]
MRSFSDLLFIFLIAAGRSTLWALCIGSYLQSSSHANRARASFLKGQPTSGQASRTIPASKLAYVQYTTSVGVGNPATYHNLVVDTGSSNTVVGTGRKYVCTSTSITTGWDVILTYGADFFSDYDTVTLAADFVITEQSIGDALQYADFGGVEGIIGVGSDQKQIFGVSFAPATISNDTNGALTYGDIDHALYTGEITYAPVTKIRPAARYWGINVTYLAYGTQTLITQSTAAFDAIPEAYLDANNTGFIVIPSSSVTDMQPLNFTMGDCVFSMDTAAQLILLDENAVIGGNTGVQYGVITALGADSAKGFDFIIGQKFIEKYYVVCDADDNCVGFAYT